MADNQLFRYLNREGRWQDFHRRGLELDQHGTLRLDALPRLAGVAPPGLANLPTPSGPAGVAVAPDGTVYYTHPDGHRVLRIDVCDGEAMPAPCIGGPGDQPSMVQHPRGVLYHPRRRAILVVDSSNHRIQLFDPDTYELLDIWGRFGQGDGEFMTPWTAVVDADGNVYIVDWGNQRVQRFNALGQADPTFWAAARQNLPSTIWPSDVAVRARGDATTVFILDADLRTVFVVDGEGKLLRAFGSDVLRAPMGLAVSGNSLYVGDNERRRVLRFKRTGGIGDEQAGWIFVGEAIGYDGPVAALALDGHGGLLVHSGMSLVPLRLVEKGGFVRKGVLCGGPFGNPSFRTEQWHRLKAAIQPLEVGAHLQLYVCRTDSGKPPPAWPSSADLLCGDPQQTADVREFADCLAQLCAPSTNGSSGPGACKGQWLRLPLDASEMLVPGGPEEDLWLAATFSGEGLTSPVLSQVRIDFDYQTLLTYLPAIYQADCRSQHFLARFLTLFQSQFTDVERSIRNRLPRLFDPAAVPAEFLPWLAGWLALDLDEDWTDARKRRVIAEAFATYARRGTAGGLQQAVQLFAEVDVRVEEPLQHAAWWSLATDEDAPPLEKENSILGFTTMLAPAEAQGAVLGTTAILDASHLISGDDFGVPLFEDVAHQFTVLMYPGPAYSEAMRDEVRSIIEREKPAHTAYHLCVVQPQLRIGYQARVGIDTVIAGMPLPTRLDAADAHVAGLVLGGEPPGRIGEQSQLGLTTRLEG